MRVHPALRIAAVLLSCVSVCLLAFWWGGGQRGPQKSARAKEGEGQGAAAAAFEFKGPASCVDCHTSPNPLRFRDLVLLNESKVWLEEDKHSKAYELLATDLGRQIGKNLGIADVQKDRQCLSCHANWQKHMTEPPQFYDLGVTCESCHGPSSDWTAPHTETAWRAKSPEEKAKLGMVDVRNPLARSRQCFSCHLGNVEEGKLITHAMYAAGHPPLPSIEIESFATQMPPHWRYLTERGNFYGKSDFLNANFGDHKDVVVGDLPRTRAVLIGGVAVLQASVDLLVEQSQQSPQTWPEFAVFDCVGCHHDLESPSWRQQRGYSATPGRPTLPQWPAALVRASLRHLAGDDDAAYAEQLATFEARFAELNDAVGRKPFGDPAAVRQAAAELNSMLSSVTSALARSKCDEVAAGRVLAVLCATDGVPDVDYHSARQIAWAARTIATELAAPYPSGWGPEPPAGEGRPERVAREKADLEIYETWKADVRAAAERKVSGWFDEVGLNESLYLNLPAGQDYKLEDTLPVALERSAAYEPATFKEQLAKLRAKLEEAD